MLKISFLSVSVAEANREPVHCKIKLTLALMLIHILPYLPSHLNLHVYYFSYSIIICVFGTKAELETEAG